MSDTPQPFIDRAFWWLVGIVGGLVATIYAIVNRDLARLERKHDQLRKDYDDHMIATRVGYERLARIEALIETAANERKEMVNMIREDIGTVHRRLDKVLEER